MTNLTANALKLGHDVELTVQINPREEIGICVLDRGPAFLNPNWMPSCSHSIVWRVQGTGQLEAPAWAWPSRSNWPLPSVPASPRLIGLAARVVLPS